MKFIFINSRQAVENMLALAAISACRLYWLVYVGRCETSLRADQLFHPKEWPAVYVYLNEPIPLEPPAVNEVIKRIAMLGGYKPDHYSEPPGLKTMWIGYQQFTVAANMYQQMLSTKT